jgi:uncharacterized damage-inducible protein DinB
MVDLTETRAILAATPAAVRSLVSPAGEDARDFHERPGAWNVREILCHLADGEIADWIPRIAIILSNGPDKRFTPFDREAGFIRYRGWTCAALLDEFERLRADSLARLDAFRIAPDMLTRTGLHPEFGAVTLDQLLACWVTHDYAHVSQISRVLVRHFGRQVGPWSKYFSLLAGAATPA